MVRISALHSVRLLQAWTGRVGGNYRHSASHLPEELRLQNGPALLALDWAQMGSKQERHSAEGTRTPPFYTHTHISTHSTVCIWTPPYRVEWRLWTQPEPTKEIGLKEKVNLLNLSMKTLTEETKPHTFEQAKKSQGHTHSCIHPHVCVHDTGAQTHTEKRSKDKYYL